MAYVTKYTVQLLKESSIKYEKQITGIDTAMEIVKNLLANKTQEEFWLICLDAKNRIIGAFQVSIGTTYQSVISTKDIFQRAILCNAVRIIVAHNHPSGDATPSKEDIDATKKIQKAGELMDIKLIDHIICGEDECISLAQQRYI